MRHLQRTREKVIKEFRKVGRVDLACAAAGVDRTTHYWWMKNDPEYRKSFEEAREEACGLLEDEAVRRAYKGTLRTQAIGGGKVMMVTEFRDQRWARSRSGVSWRRRKPTPFSLPRLRLSAWARPHRTVGR